MSKILECEVFKGNNPLTGLTIWNQRVNGGSEVIKDKLKTTYKWDGTSNIASIAAKLKEDTIDGWQLHLYGKSKGVKFESSVFYADQEEGNHVRIQEIDLDSFVFRGSMVSEWLSPDEFKWEFRLPHEKDAKRYHRVNKADMVQYNAKPLWVRAVTQVIPGPKLSVFLGAAPTDDIKGIPGSTEGQFPLILIEKFSVPFFPFEDENMGLGMGPIPFLIDDRIDLEFDSVSSTCPDGQTVKTEMSQFLRSAIKPNQRNEVGTWTKEVAAGNWTARAPNYTVPHPKPLAGDVIETEDDDNAGQQNNFLLKGKIFCDFHIMKNH